MSKYYVICDETGDTLGSYRLLNNKVVGQGVDSCGQHLLDSMLSTWRRNMPIYKLSSEEELFEIIPAMVSYLSRVYLTEREETA